MTDNLLINNQFPSTINVNLLFDIISTLYIYIKIEKEKDVQNIVDSLREKFGNDKIIYADMVKKNKKQ